jgi:ParB family chromosome partitioning protein
VRETERIASHAKQRHQKERKKLDPAFDRLSLRLSERFSTKVTCMWGKKKGKIIIEFYSKGELERVASFLAAEELTH